MKVSHKNKLADKSKGMSGLAILELSIFLPVFLLIFVSVIDLSLRFAKYVQLSSICYEGLRQLTQERGLEEGKYNESQAQNHPIHYSIQNRLRVIIELNKSRIPEEISFTTEKNEDDVKIEVVSLYKPLMPLYGNLSNIRIVMVGPYLFG